MNRNVWRRFTSTFALSLIYALTGLALVPLGLVLWYTIAKGLPQASHLSFYLNDFRPVGIPGGGISNAIVGTAEMVAMASLVAIPVGVIGGVYLAEYGHGRWASWVRLASDVLVGAPSIAIGLFAYAILVVPFHHYSATSASVALAILMLP
jgi:phosphate transport system permease protein